jgi:predicted phage tail protein
MGVVLGFMAGLLAAVAGIGFLAYWVCTRLNNIAVARVINGIAQALASPQSKSREQGTTTGTNSRTREKNTTNEGDTLNLRDG